MGKGGERHFLISSHSALQPDYIMKKEVFYILLLVAFLENSAGEEKVKRRKRSFSPLWLIPPLLGKYALYRKLVYDSILPPSFNFGGDASVGVGPLSLDIKGGLGAGGYPQGSEPWYEPVPDRKYGLSGELRLGQGTKQAYVGAGFGVDLQGGGGFSST